MSRFFSSSKALLAALGLLALPVLSVSLLPAPALAQSSAKALVDAAKAGGTVGEQGDGYLGLVTGSADAATKAAMAAARLLPKLPPRPG